MSKASREPAPAVAAMVSHCCLLFRDRIQGLGTAAGLVVGCGTADEVVYMRREFGNVRAVGIDFEMQFSAAARAEGCAVVGDAQSLPFGSEIFGFAAAFHSLEHVGDPEQLWTR